MFYKIKGGSKILLSDNASPEKVYECYLPPVPNKSQILFHNLPKKDQYWRRTPMTADLEKRMEEEARVRQQEELLVKGGNKKKVDFVDPVCERYRRQEFYRRKWGVWFMNNGEPTYITGHHYFYLQWCKYDHKENNGYPFYYEFSRDTFYVRQWCEENPLSLGYMIIGPRGTGKSSEEIACLTNNITMAHNSTAAMQSKNYEKDTKGILFASKLVPLFNNLPDFFKPVFSHGTNPSTTFTFTRKADTSKHALKVKFGPDYELTSHVVLALPNVKALDGETATEIFEDEIGKQEPAIGDIYERHKTNLKVVFRNHRKVGLLRKTSTVEHMKEGGAECLKLYRESNPRIKDKNGQTVSKIYRYLISSLDTDTSPECCNIYGQVDRVKANEKLENSYELIKHDYVALASEMRKNPRNEAEAFIPDQSKSVFNIQKCSNRVNKIRNEMTVRPYTQGNLYWVKDKFDKVWFKPDDHAGRFKFAWFPDEYKNTTNPDERKILNNWEKVWDFDIKGNSRLLVVPKNDHLFRIASDPIKYVKTKDPRASKAAIHGFRLFDYHVDGGKPKEQWQTHNFIFEYCVRPEDPETSFEDVAKACMFLGCRVLPERNIPSLNDYFERNGLEKLMAYPKDFYSAGVDIQYKSDDAGLASTGEVIDYYIRRLITFINEHVDRMPFDDTIEDWMNFDPSNPSPSHLTVSSGFTLVHAEKVTLNEQRPESKLSDWFDTFDNRGVNGNFMSESLIIR